MNINDLPKIQIYNRDWRPYIKNIYDCVEKNNLWDWIKEYDPKYGFMFSSHKNIQIIMNDEKVSNDCHSCATFGITMRMVQRISNIGLFNFKCECG